MTTQVRQHWQDYAFLTKEMSKFLGRKDYELFFELQKQRDQLQMLLDEAADNGFKRSPEGQQLLQSIRQENSFITTQLKITMNQLQQQHNVSQAYDGGAPQAGRRFDSQS